MRQSADVWFHPASATRAAASSNSAAPRGASRASAGSGGAITRIEMAGLAEARQSASDPIRLPVDQARERHARIAEQPHGLGGVDEPSVGCLAAGKNRRLVKPTAERLDKPTHTDGL